MGWLWFGAKKRQKAVEKTGWEKIGTITHYFPRPKAGVIKLTRGGLSVGEKIRVEGATSSFEQWVSSMEKDRQPIQEARKGAEIGVEMKKRVRQHDTVYRATT